MGLDVVDQPLLVFAHAEEVVGLPDRGDFAPAFRALALDQILFRIETLAADAVPAGVFGFVNLVAVVKFLQDLPDHLLVVFVGGADEAVVGDAEPFPQLLEAHDGFIRLLLRGNSPFGRCLFDLLPMFVGAGQEEGIHIQRTVVARQNVGQDRGVGMTDVRLVVDVVNRGGYIEVVGIHGHLASRRY